MERAAVADSSPDFKIDVISACACCSIDNVDWKAFLEYFQQNTPERGIPSVLRFHADEDGRDGRVGVVSHACRNDH